LVATAGHDLRQPLQAMTAAYDWLERRLTTGSEQEYLRRGRWALSRLSNQLDMLIETLRLHQHAASIQPEPVALETVFARVWRDNEDLASRKGLTLRALARGAVVMSDGALLEGILRNLVRNALKCTGPEAMYLSDAAAADRC
jgi:signal transduction histidine kinase